MGNSLFRVRSQEERYVHNTDWLCKKYNEILRKKGDIYTILTGSARSTMKYFARGEICTQ
jgi:hypothetical protein